MSAQVQTAIQVARALSNIIPQTMQVQTTVKLEAVTRTSQAITNVLHSLTLELVVELTSRWIHTRSQTLRSSLPEIK